MSTFVGFIPGAQVLAFGVAVIGWIATDIIKEFDEMVDEAMWVEWQNAKSKGLDAAIQFLQLVSTNLVLGARIWMDKYKFDYIDVDQSILNNIFKGKYNDLEDVMDDFPNRDYYGQFYTIFFYKEIEKYTNDTNIIIDAIFIN